jgi:glycine/D-amino acid oxidase-like deaminating enzyme
VSSSLFSSDFKTDPYWWDRVPRPDLDAAPPPGEADVVVIGSGYTGLGAALVTQRGGRTTVVLDAEAAGFGCSTRNGGQISTSVKPDFAALSARHGPERAAAVLGEGRAALAWIEAFVAAEKIDCDFAAAGRFHAAHNAAAFRRLVRAVESEPAGLETGAVVVPRDAQRAEIGTDAYHGGVVYPRHASVDPAKLHAGMLARVLAAGAAVVPYCPATAIVRDGGRFTVATPRGAIRTRDVVVATNGYTGPLTPWLRRRVIPIGSYVIATEPLAEEVVARLIPQNRVVSDTRRVVYYYRASPDRRRILFGGRVSIDETDPRVSGPRLHAEMVRLFPELAGARISHSWAGTVAYTFDTLAHTGSHEGIHYAMGYCGSGVSMAGYLGTRLGEKVLGRAEGLTGYDGLPFETRPLYTGRPWFLAPSVAWYRWLDGRPW